MPDGLAYTARTPTVHRRTPPYTATKRAHRTPPYYKAVGRHGPSFVVHLKGGVRSGGGGDHLTRLDPTKQKRAQE